MTLNCQTCGLRSNEVKPSGRISKLASKITLIVENENDLKREVIKSDSAGIEIPELQLTLMEGGMGGIYTTVEGLLQKMYDSLAQEVGKSLSSACSSADYEAFLEKLQRMKNGDASILPFTLMINDPLSNSFIGPNPQQKNVLDIAKQNQQQQSLLVDDEGYNNGMISGEHNLIVEEYERTFEQNEALGLNDIRINQLADDKQEVDEER